jgi:O-antigen ligase
LALAGRPLAVDRTRSQKAGRGPISGVVILSFVTFACSMPFEAAYLLGGEGTFSISRLIGYMFFGLALLRPGLCFRKPANATWWFLLYYAMYVITGFYQPAPYLPEILSTAFRLTQFLVLFWAAYNLFKIERVARWALWGFALACVAVGALLAAGFGVKEFRGVAGRGTVFGNTPNTIASLIGLGGVILIGMAYGKTGVRPRTKLIAWGGFLVIAAGITRTGSRGALLGLAVGIVTLVTSHGSAKTRLRNLIIVALALAACVGITLASRTSSTRWHRTIDEGSVAGRDRIFRAAFWMFVERPLVGWGPATNYYELGRRLGLPKRDTHNLLLWLLTEQGIVGTTLFSAGLILCLRGAWRARKGAQGLLPLALLGAVMAVNLSGTYYVTKWFWFVLAYAAASETYVRRRPVRVPPLRVRASRGLLNAGSARIPPTPRFGGGSSPRRRAQRCAV